MRWFLGMLPWLFASRKRLEAERDRLRREIEKYRHASVSANNATTDHGTKQDTPNDQAPTKR